MTDNDDTVAVPVELAERVAEALNTQGAWPQMAEDIRALIPKPKPRLVAVDMDQIKDLYHGSAIWAHLTAQPDLLTVLDGVLDGLNDRGWLDGPGVQNAKDDLRRALGVPDAE